MNESKKLADALKMLCALSVDLRFYKKIFY